MVVLAPLGALLVDLSRLTMTSLPPLETHDIFIPNRAIQDFLFNLDSLRIKCLGNASNAVTFLADQAWMCYAVPEGFHTLRVRYAKTRRSTGVRKILGRWLGVCRFCLILGLGLGQV